MLTKSDKKWLHQYFATKDDLKPFVTKEDLKKYTTKEDLSKAFIGVARTSDLDDLEERFVDNLQKWKSELFDKIDVVLNRLKTTEQEKEILEARQDEREKFDSRIEKLEKIHPNSRHSFK